MFFPNRGRRLQTVAQNAEAFVGRSQQRGFKEKNGGETSCKMFLLANALAK
jgi:hypothetical protein